MSRRQQVITPDLADRIISSMLVNGDWNPDVIVIAAQEAQQTRRAVNTDEIVRVIEKEGHVVHDDLTVDWV